MINPLPIKAITLVWGSWSGKRSAIREVRTREDVKLQNKDRRETAVWLQKEKVEEGIKIGESSLERMVKREEFVPRGRKEVSYSVVRCMKRRKRIR